MDNNKINEVEVSCIIILFILSSGFVLPLGTQAHEDIWIVIFTGMVLSIGMAKIYSYIVSKYDNKNFFKVIEIVFGKFIGTIINILFIWFGIHLCALTLYDFGEFPTSTTLNNTPLVIFFMGMMILSIWLVKKGPVVIGKSAVIIVFLTSPIPVFTVLLLIPKMDYLNIMPLLHCGLSNFMKGTLSTFTFPFGETFVAIALIEEIKDKKNMYKSYAIGILIGGITLVGVTVSEILVVGHNIYSNTYFPVYVVASQASVGEFIERMEIVTILATSVSSFIKISVCLYFTCKGISTLLNMEKYNYIVSPVGLLIVGIGYRIFPSAMGFVSWGINIYPYYAIVFEVFLPLIVFLGVYINKNKRGKVGN
ncbi:MAG: endospore germination permease [Anaeromicrobium sp.]|jgi:spore germination protein KB|uniref:GerAB/ArcD/ProY family transporter n=1 Tax=Anaeromicrobium sp. TaxID=1929132 RepID=UPI0025F66122|nr:endospore germination permease [Anaeromicrobium sp.]MCT4594538.1 endospore germination permease [Anaeromicrobium sp.]